LYENYTQPQPAMRTYFGASLMRCVGGGVACVGAGSVGGEGGEGGGVVVGVDNDDG
jgi:hypothetical protein